MEPVTRISEQFRPPPLTRAPAVTPVLAIERRAWFDLNGDGQISDKSAALGGDAYLVGDGNGDGRVAEQLTYEPLAVRSRPAPGGSSGTAETRDDTAATCDADPVAAALQAAATRAALGSHSGEVGATSHGGTSDTGDPADRARTERPAPEHEATAHRPDAALVRRAEAAYREMAE